MTKYELRTDKGPWVPVTEEEFIAAERRAGFLPKPGCGPLATAGFGVHPSGGTSIEGRLREMTAEEAFSEGYAQARMDAVALLKKRWTTRPLDPEPAGASAMGPQALCAVALQQASADIFLLREKQ